MKCSTCGEDLVHVGGSTFCPACVLKGCGIEDGKLPRALPPDLLSAQYPLSVQLREARGQALRWRRCALGLLAGIIDLEGLEAQLGLVVRTCTTCGVDHTGTGSACERCAGGG